jgi:hypothetical protein
MKLADGSLPTTPTSVSSNLPIPRPSHSTPIVQTNKSIAKFLAQNRAKNNASNRSEFLYSLSDRRRHIQESSEINADASLDTSQIGSCARTDAKPIDRDEQMKYDIAKNNDEPISRTMKAISDVKEQGLPTTIAPEKL